MFTAAFTLSGLTCQMKLNETSNSFPFWILGPSLLSHMQYFTCFHGWVVFHCVCVHHIFFIHSSSDGLSGCFHVLAAVNNTTVNLGCIYLFELMFLYSLDKFFAEVELLDHMGSSSLNFLRNLHIVFHIVPVYIPTSSVWGFPLLPLLSNTCYLSFRW